MVGVRTRAAALAVLLALPARPAAAWDMAGTKQIALRTSDGASVPIGTVTFSAQGGDRYAYALRMDYARFKPFFLSMRDFKCIEGKEIECYVPYPYKNPHEVAHGDLRWLEHDLLFFFKAPNDYGAKLGNGLYYALKPTDGGLVGKPQAIDLNKIAAPPDDLSKPPYAPEDRDDIPDGSRWITELDIH